MFVQTDDTGQADELAARQASVKDLSEALAAKKGVAGIENDLRVGSDDLGTALPLLECIPMSEFTSAHAECRMAWLRARARDYRNDAATAFLSDMGSKFGRSRWRWRGETSSFASIGTLVWGSAHPDQALLHYFERRRSCLLALIVLTVFGVR